MLTSVMNINCRPGWFHTCIQELPASNIGYSDSHILRFSSISANVGRDITSKQPHPSGSFPTHHYRSCYHHIRRCL